MVFATKVYKGAIIFFLIIAVMFCIFSFSLNEKFFVKFSTDKNLQEATLEKINQLDTFLLYFSFLFLGLAILCIPFKKILLKTINRNKTLIQGFLILLVTLLIIFGAIETSLRIVFNDQTHRLGGPGSLKFENKYIQLNEQGYRDLDFNIEKQKTRIVILGDSFTYGSGVKNPNNLYPKLLEKRLNGEGYNVEILNFGKPSLGTKEELEVLKQDALNYNPDIVIIGYVLNDFENVERENLVSQEQGNKFISFWLRDLSYTYFFLEVGFKNMFSSLSYSKSYSSRLISSFNSPENQEINEKYFEEFKSLSEENNFTPIIVIFPWFYHLDDYPFNEAHQIVTRMSEENQIEFLDLLDYYKSHLAKDLIVNPNDEHPNELANKIAADQIYTLLKEKLNK